MAGTEPDEFANPYSRFGARRSFGGEVQALTILNLLNADSLERLRDRWQLALVTLWGLVVGAVLSWQRPWHAVWVAGSASLLITGTAVYLQLQRHVLMAIV